MLSLLRPPYRFCDGILWRAFLNIGELSLSGLTLANNLCSDSEHSPTDASRLKSIIHDYLHGEKWCLNSCGCTMMGHDGTAGAT